MKKILLTGGTGYIGSHTCLSLLEKGYEVLILDSCINSSEKVLKNVIKIYEMNKAFDFDRLKFIRGDVRDKNLLKNIFKSAIEDGNPIIGVIHLAGLKSVSESIKKPIEYWDSNVIGTINLIQTMEHFKCTKFIFSSSATIYGLDQKGFVNEGSIINPINPYGSTKATIEKFLKDLFNKKNDNWSIINLRYFNPIGAHPSGLIGENPMLNCNNIFPIILDAAHGKIDSLEIFGNSWETNDGTCIRDYIHVLDLASAHIKALQLLFESDSKFLNLNIGTGKGTSVLELINTFERVNNIKIRYTFSPRREGDVPKIVADNTKANKIFNWKPRKNIKDMCKDGWRWKVLFPNGY